MRIDQRLDFLRAAHPRFWPDRLGPIGEAWNEAKILADMLFTNPAVGMTRPVDSVIVGPKMVSASQIPAE